MSLVDQLIAKFKARPGDWIPGASVEKWVTAETKYTASNARRRLRELVETGVLKQKEEKYKGVNHAWYSFDPENSTAVRYKYVPDGIDEETKTVRLKRVPVV